MKHSYNYKHALDILMDESDYFRSYRSVSSIVDSWEEFCILNHLMNTGAMLRANRNDGWFECMVKHIEDKFGKKLGHRNIQSRVLKSLEAKGLVSLKRVGSPPKRNIRVELDVVLSLLVKNDRIPAENSNNTESSCLNASNNTESCQLNNTESCRTYTSKKSSLRSDSSNRDGSRKPARSARKRSDEPHGEGFFNNNGYKPHSQLADWAIRLRTVVKDHLKVNMTKFFQSRWEDVFRRLSTEYGQETVERVLAWYEQYTKTHPNPKRIKHAKGFEWYFDTFLERANAQKGTSLPTKLEMTPAEKKEVDPAVESLRMLVWPKGSSAQLDHAVVVSLRNQAKFRKWAHARLRSERERIKALTRKNKGRISSDETRYIHFLEEVTSKLATGGDSGFVLGWLRKVHKRIATWDGFNGDLSRYVLDTNSKEFRLEVQRVCSEYGASLKLVDKLMEELNASGSDA